MPTKMHKRKTKSKKSGKRLNKKTKTYKKSMRAMRSKKSMKYLRKMRGGILIQYKGSIKIDDNFINDNLLEEVKNTDVKENNSYYITPENNPTVIVPVICIFNDGPDGIVFRLLNKQPVIVKSDSKIYQKREMKNLQQLKM